MKNQSQYLCLFCSAFQSAAAAPEKTRTVRAQTAPLISHHRHQVPQTAVLPQPVQTLHRSIPQPMHPLPPLTYRTKAALFPKQAKKQRPTLNKVRNQLQIHMNTISYLLFFPRAFRSLKAAEYISRYRQIIRQGQTTSHFPKALPILQPVTRSRLQRTILM